MLPYSNTRAAGVNSVLFYLLAYLSAIRWAFTEPPFFNAKRDYKLYSLILGSPANLSEPLFCVELEGGPFIISSGKYIIERTLRKADHLNRQPMLSLIES